MKREPGVTRERDASACMRRHQAIAMAPPRVVTRAHARGDRAALLPVIRFALYQQMSQ